MLIPKSRCATRLISRPIAPSPQKTIAQYGGRYLVRDGGANLIEGDPPPKTIVIVEFPTTERLREWYASPEYAEALKLRQTALDRRLIFVEGVAPV
jgi:uncharacterized protein (DUF1330 family)